MECFDKPTQFPESSALILDYVNSNRLAETQVGAYSFSKGGPPVLYASCYAVLTLHLFGELQILNDGLRKKWSRYIQSFQCDDGLFRDPTIDIPLASEIDWWGWRHLTMHALMALSALGSVAEKKFEIVHRFSRKNAITEWLETRRWDTEPANVSNEVQNHATILQYARDFQKERMCNDILTELYSWLNKRQDPKTGLWGEMFHTPQLLSYAVQTGYHLWLLYFYDKQPIQYVDRIIDSCLATQNKYGGFGVPFNSSACEDIDTIDPLARLYFLTDYRRQDIRAAFEKAEQWILVNVNNDGGMVFRRHEALQYGHVLTSGAKNQSTMFPTWFRSLAYSYLMQVLEPARGRTHQWHFLDCPGMQFWRNDNALRKK